MFTRPVILLALLAAISGPRSVSAGTDLVNGDLDIAVAPSSTLVSFQDMAPGDSVEGSLTVDNSGSIDLRYAIQGVATNADGRSLKDALLLTIEEANGTEIYSGDLDGDDGALVGDASSGQQTGDRTLGSGHSEELRFVVELPLDAPNAVQQAATTATFTFAAEQATQGDSDGSAGSPSVGTGDSGLRNADEHNKANPINPLVPLAVFAAGLSILLIHAGRAATTPATDDTKDPAGPADSS